MNKTFLTLFFLIIMRLTNSVWSQTTAARTNVLILKDGQEIIVDSVKINQLDCELSFVMKGNWVRQSICIGFIHFFYDPRGSVRNFDERPCACDQATFIIEAISNAPKATNDVLILIKGDNVVADVGSVQIDTKKLIINYLQNKKKQKVKYCETKEIRFADGKTQTIDDTLCKPKK